MVRRYELKAELRRLTMARFDLEAAQDLCDTLKERGHVDGLDWGPLAWGLWTGVAVSYARPFKEAKLQLRGEEWQSFADEELMHLHCRLIRLRDTLFAHNDVTPYRTVVVFPPDAWSPEGSTSEEQSAFKYDDIERVRCLCAVQIERLRTRIAELLQALFAGEQHESGTILSLEDILDEKS